jgi:radical SAM protein with 4Fe4S-binding SPASM domain
MEAKFELDTLNIIKTDYGVKKIEPCFGFMKIEDPYKEEAKNFSTPQEMRESKEEYTSRIRDILFKTNQCIQCWLFERCYKTSKINLSREKA